jgi:hypothetical protein
MFMMSFFKIPKDARKKLDRYISRFFWQGGKDKKKICLAKCDIMCRPKNQGGLGIVDLAIKNNYLLSEWLFDLLNGDVIWQTLIKKTST